MHGDRGRYLVNMGEKCNLMIPWTKGTIFFHFSYGSNHTIVLHLPQAIVSQLLSSQKYFILWTNQIPVAFKMSIEMSSEQAKYFLTFQIGINFIFLQFILLALVVLSSITKKGEIVAKMASHAIFQYNVLAIDDTHNTWTNIIIKINIPRLLGSSDDKEKIGVARPEGPPLRGFRYPVSGRGSRGSRPSRISGQRPESSSIQEHRKNRRRGIGASGGSRKNRRQVSLQAPVEPTVQNRASVHW